MPDTTRTTRTTRKLPTLPSILLTFAAIVAIARKSKLGKLLGTSKKTKLSETIGVLSRVLYLSPADESGINVCPYATDGCRDGCLGKTSGMMVLPTHKRARIRKTRALFRDRKAFLSTLAVDIAATVRAAERAGMAPAVRLNGASDLPWERIRFSDGRNLFELFPSVAFYDYTKDASRAAASLEPGWPANYRLLLSRSGENDAECIAHLASGGNVAVVFRHDRPLPRRWNGFRVIDGDAHDARHLDPAGVVVGLKAKGKARRDATGFVVR